MATTATTGSAGSCNWKERFAAGTRADTDVLVSGGKAGTEAELASDKRWSNPRLSDRALVGGGNGQPHGELPRRIRRKVPANRRKLQADEVEDLDDMDQDVNLLNKEKENLRLQLALKTKELELEEIRRLKLELVLKTKENESLLKQNDELKAENEQLKKSAKPPKARRFCRSCQSYEFHDSRNCPEKPQAARSSEEEVSD